MTSSDFKLLCICLQRVATDCCEPQKLLLIADKNSAALAEIIATDVHSPLTCLHELKLMCVLEASLQ
eukprot:4029-Heterococcus_DN1.PRE.8